MAKATPSIVSQAPIAQAAGNNAALKQVLTQLANAANTQATKTSTSAKNPPNQSTATVAYNAPFYELNFTDPGGATAGSPAQTAQQAATGSLGSNPTQSVIYHQVEAATSVLFDAANNLTQFGGDTGSLQTQFLMSLDSTRQWYFRIRTSFDGQTWNQWKTINNAGLTANPNGVVKTGITGGYYAAVTLPGQQVVGFGIGQVPSGGSISTASGVTIANTIGIAGAATVNDTGRQAIGIRQCSIATNGTLTLAYREADDSAPAWTGNASYLTFGWTLGAQNLQEVVTANGSWIIMVVAGGCHVAIGSGVTTPGQAISFPAGYGSANSMAVCTPASVIPPDGHDAHGIAQSEVVNGVPTVLYGDGEGNRWGGNANWFAIAWEAPLSTCLQQVAGGQYLILPTPSGPLAIGVGKSHSGVKLPLPSGGYSYEECVAFCCLDGYDDIGEYMHGVELATVDVGSSSATGTLYGLYTNGSQQWPGNVSWFAVAWLS